MRDAGDGESRFPREGGFGWLLLLVIFFRFGGVHFNGEKVIDL